MKITIKLITVLLILVDITFAQPQAELIGEDIVVFYPPNFAPSQTLPSMALISEPDSIGPMPPAWNIIPEFYTQGGLHIASITTEEDTDLYGTGEVIGDLRRNNTEVELWNTDNYGYSTAEGKRLYQSHPWILAVRTNGTSYGILIDHTWKQRIILNNPIEIISEGPPFRIIIIERESPQEVMLALAELIGKPELPPIWALGYHQCRYSYYPDTEALEIADKFREKELPCDVIWFDIDYMDQYKIFTFDPTGYSSPAYVNSYLHENGFRSIWMIDPGVKQQSGYFVYDQGTTGDYWVKTADGNTYYGDVWPGSCAFPDFTMPETREWWSGLYPPYMAHGMDGVWNDMNEPAVFNDTKTMPEDNVHRGGNDLPEDIHRRYHNVFGMLMVKATREGILQSNPDKRPFVLTRANFLGGHRYAATWTGDNQSTWEHLRMSIPMSLNLSLSGQPFNGPDIGGFIGSPGAELLGQWLAVGAFYPFCRNHSTKGSHPQEPWAYGQEIEDISRIALQRRYCLLPYLYTLFYEASQNGMPVMQPVFFADPSDLSLRNEQQAFLWGENLLIIPSWADNPALPMGHWRDISIIDPELEDDGYQPELKQKPGSVMPFSEIIQSTNDYSSDQITLLIAPDENHEANGQLYADAGNGFGYLDNDFLLTGFTVFPTFDDSLQVNCLTTAGNLNSENRSYRAGLVTSYGTFYSEWTEDSIFKIPLQPDLYVEIVSPQNGEKFDLGEEILLSPELTGDLFVNKVSWYANDNQLLAEINTEPWEFLWFDAETGIYDIRAVALTENDLQISSRKISIQVGDLGSGEITYEVWWNIGGGPHLSDLTNNPNYPDYPDENNILNRFETPKNIGDEFGARVIGYLHPPHSGNYSFWISGDDFCEFWLSTDSLEANKQLVCEVPGWTVPGEWNKYPEQHSAEIYLESGNKYFIMGLQKEAYDNDHLTVAWELSGENPEIIHGAFLSPYNSQTYVEEHVQILNPLKIYPNPANDEFYITTKGQQGKIVICNLNGAEVSQFMIKHDQRDIKISTSGLNNGIYTIWFESIDRRFVEKLVVVK